VGIITPHAAQPHVSSLTIPKVMLPPQVAADISYLSRHTKSEVGFMGLVTKESFTSEESVMVLEYYTVTEIMLLDQQCHSATTELSEAAMAELGVALLARGENGADYDRLRFWGHTHPFGSTSPSGQDNNQMSLFRRNGCPWFLRGIFAPQKMEWTLFDFYRNLVSNDVPWEVLYEVENRDAFWAEEIRNKVHAFSAYSGIQTKPPRGSKHNTKGSQKDAATTAEDALIEAGGRQFGLNMEGDDGSSCVD